MLGVCAGETKRATTLPVGSIFARLFVAQVGYVDYVYTNSASTGQRQAPFIAAAPLADALSTFVHVPDFTHFSRNYCMRLLLSNDDGYQAPGLTALRAAVAEMCDDLVTVAPDRNRSGASNSLTLERPLRVTRVAEGLYSVDGTPTDCVHLATTGLFEQDADMVVSGINHGANLGDDVLYSGTVAAATEGRSLGLPAVAISLVGENPRHYDTAARVAVAVVRLLIDRPLPNDTILNVNVPDLTFEALGGYAATRLGNRHRAERLIEDSDPRGRPIFWIGRAGGEADAGQGTDFHAVAQGQVSITPIQIDLTRHDALSSVSEWVQRL